MNETNETAVGVVFAIVVVLLVLFGGGAMTGATMSGGMMGNGVIGGMNWMWIPGLLILQSRCPACLGHIRAEEVKRALKKPSTSIWRL